MDKFEMKQMEKIKEVVEDLQSCFIENDRYSGIPSKIEWRQAARLTHRLTLMCFEIVGYSNAVRQCEIRSIQEKLKFVLNSEE